MRYEIIKENVTVNPGYTYESVSIFRTIKLIPDNNIKLNDSIAISVKATIHPSDYKSIAKVLDIIICKANIFQEKIVKRIEDEIKTFMGRATTIQIADIEENQGKEEIEVGGIKITIYYKAYSRLTVWVGGEN